MDKTIRALNVVSKSRAQSLGAFWSQSQQSYQFSNFPTARSKDISSLLSTPTWSVRSLVPSSSEATNTPRVSSEQLHHLLRLSALPPPKDQIEEERMLKTLSSQLSFVEAIQGVNTTNVCPLQSIRDETAEAERENEITMAKLKGAFEKRREQFNSRTRSGQNSPIDTKDAEDWDPLAHTSRKVGRFFVVESGKE